MKAGDRPSITFMVEMIRLLEAEIEILNEWSEDVLLLGLVAENIAPLRDLATTLMGALKGSPTQN